MLVSSGFIFYEPQVVFRLYYSFVYFLNKRSALEYIANISFPGPYYTSIMPYNNTEYYIRLNTEYLLDARIRDPARIIRGFVITVDQHCNVSALGGILKN